MHLRFSSFVTHDIAEITEYISQGSPAQAAKLIRLILQGMEDAASNSKLYRLRPELGPEVRLLPAGNYVILFRAFEDFVRIERVVHGSRDLFNLAIGDRSC